MISLKTSRSEALYERALQVMVGGVNSPVRAFKAVGGKPLFIARGKGSRIWDVDGNSFIDYVCSWGPLILGHSKAAVVEAALEAIENGTSFGAPTEPELKLAEKICASIASIEKLRFVNSGTEATMSALRLARAYTSRSKVLKFDGCYHGHADPFLTQAGSGLATFDIPNSLGVTRELSVDTVTIPFNDIPALEEAFRKSGHEFAAVIVEPVAGNMGVVPPKQGFLQAIRDLCSKNGCLLIFDEVITGFRLSMGGAQTIFGIKPDITCLGKIIGGGFPAGAYGGRRDVMQLVSPEGPVYQAGTLSGNPIAMTAGLTTISLLNNTSYEKLERIASSLERGLKDSADHANLPITINRVGSMVGLFFGSEQVRNYEDTKRTNHGLYAKFHHGMLTAGVYLPPSPFETVFLSTAHSHEDVESTVDAARRAFRECAR